MIVQEFSESATLATNTILQKPTNGIPSWQLNIMEHGHIERLTGVQPGDYRRNPEQVYADCLRAIGVCMLDQWIPTNPLSMGDCGFDDVEKGATTGAERIEKDGIPIDSPEAVVQHLEQFVFPQTQESIATFDENACVQQIIHNECQIQEQLGPTILKTGYGFVGFPHLRYSEYGYVNYFMAYALYPEIMEKDFSLQADLALINNQAAARAYAEGNLPPLHRLDDDMADSRGTLVDIESLDKIWFPHFSRSLEPILQTDVKMIWHCDGNLMQMVPRLLDVGLSGFQGFQYEDGMDYERICQMKTKDGQDLIIVAGVSVTQTLPHGKPEDVKKELQWLVEKAPKNGLFLAASSSITPGVPWENIKVLVEGLNYYRTQGR